MTQNELRHSMPPIEPSPTKRQRQVASGKRRVIAAAAEILRTRGTHGANLRAIGERAGMSRGIVNYYFGTRTQLLLLACEHLTGARPAETHDGAIDRHVWEWLAAQKGKAS